MYSSPASGTAGQSKPTQASKKPPGLKNQTSNERLQSAKLQGSGTGNKNLYSAKPVAENLSQQPNLKIQPNLGINKTQSAMKQSERISGLGQKPNDSQINLTMKNTKTPVSVLMKQGKSHGPIVSSKHQEIETPGANNEEIDTPTEVVIVDFASQVCQQKTMARELPKFTKNESPFYLNQQTGSLYKWIGLSTIPILEGQEESKGNMNESTNSEAMINFEFQEVATHGQKITDFAYSKKQRHPVCFFSNEKGEVFYTKTAGSGTHDALMAPNASQRLSGSSEQLSDGGFHFPQNISLPDMLQPKAITKLSAAIKSTFISQVACGVNHVLLLTSSGFVYSFGSNEFGQLGNPNDIDDEDSDGNQSPVVRYESDPAIIFGLLNHKVTSIHCGSNHSLVLAQSRNQPNAAKSQFGRVESNRTFLYAWGSNKYGQLGLPQETVQMLDNPQIVEQVVEKQVEEVLCGNQFTALKTRDMNLYYLGHRIQTPLPIQLQREAYMHVNTSDSSLIFSTGNTLNRITEDSNDVQSISIPCLSQQHKVVEILPYRELDANSQSVLVVIGECAYNDGQSSFRDSVVASEIPNETSHKKVFEHDSLETTPVQSFVGRLNSAVNLGGMSLSDNFRAFSRSSALTTENESVPTTPHSSKSEKTFEETLQMEYANLAKNSSSEINTLLQYIALTGNSKNLGLTEQQYKAMLQQTGPIIDERDKLPGEDTLVYLKRKKERIRVIERKRTEWLKKQHRLERTKKTWENEIFPNWDNVKRTKRVREMWTEGLPRSIRGKVWFLAFGNRSAITRDLFNIMAERGQKLKALLKEHSQTEQLIIENGGEIPLKKEDVTFPQFKPDAESRNLSSPADVYEDLSASGQSKPQSVHSEQERKNKHQQQIETLQEIYAKVFKLRKKLSMLISMDEKGVPSFQAYLAREKSINIIDTDIPRTFPKLGGLFATETASQVKLRRILEAFTMYRPDIGYVQGMSYVAATLLLFMDNEYQSFVTFCNLMTKYPIMPFYSFNDVLVRKIMQLYKQVFAYNLPELCEHFELENIQPKVYLYEWFMTLFTRAFDLRIVTRVWDFYFLDGIFVLFQTAIAILRMLEDKMIDEEFDEILPILQNVSQHITEDDEDEFVKLMYDVSFPKWVYEEIPLLESEFFKQDLI